MVSWVGTCPGPPPVFSGLKLDVGLHKKLGFKTYPQRPLGRKRPWFRSICSPGVWKFSATVENNGVNKDAGMAMRAIKHRRLSEAVSSGMNAFWHFSAEQSAFASQLQVWRTDPSGSLRSTFPADHSWMIGGAGQRGRSGSAVCCCVSQKASLQMKR